MKKILNKDSQLVNERLKSLSDYAESAICPQGKWHGLDVFTWLKPSSLHFESTIIAFPFPVILVFYDYESLEKSKHAISFHDWVFSCILIDQTIINGEDLEGVVVVPDLESLSKSLYGLKMKAIVLFVFNDDIGNKNIPELIMFLNSKNA